MGELVVAGRFVGGLQGLAEEDRDDLTLLGLREGFERLDHVAGRICHDLILARASPGGSPGSTFAGPEARASEGWPTTSTGVRGDQPEAAQAAPPTL